MTTRNHSRFDSAAPTQGVRRFDVAEMGELRPAMESEEGFLILDVYIAKPGILTYVDRHGEKWRELIETDELHKDASLETLVGKPVTLEHPDDDVTPDSDPTISKGAISPNIKVVSDGRVRIEYMVQKRDAIDAVKSGAKREASPGYRCDLDRTPGVHPEFGSYDRRQINRRYNHGAICERARGGPEIHLRYDSDAAMVSPNPPEDIMEPKLAAAFLAFLMSSQGMSRTDAEAETKKAADMAAENAQMKKDMAGMQEKIDMFEAKAKKDKEENLFGKGEEEDEPMSKKDALVFAQAYAKERAELVERAARFDAVDPATFSDNDALRKAIVLAANPSARKDALPAYYAAAFDMITEPSTPANPTRSTWSPSQPKVTEARKDGLGPNEMPNPEAGARAAMAAASKR